MCNCNSSFCAVCCRRVKAYRFDNVPEITGDLQLYTEFYKVGEAYGHWKFTVDDLEAYLDIPTVLWNDKLVAFGHTATGGLFYDSAFIWNYTDSALTIGTRDIGAEGLYSFTIGNTNTAEGQYSLIVGASNVTNTAHSAVFGKANSILGSYNSIFGEANNINGNGNNVFGAGNIVGDNSNIFGASLDTNGFYGNAMFSDLTGGSVAIANDAFTAQFAGGYRFRLDASSTAVNISSTGIVAIDNVVNNNTETQLLVWNVTTKEVEYRTASSLPGGGGGSGTVTSVDAAFLNGTALTVVGGAITTAGTFDFEWQGLNTDYVAGDGSIIAFPTLTSGTVTSVSAGNGMTFTTITTSGAVTLGTPSSITLASTNSVGVGTHSHLFAPGGTTAQYIRGDGTLATTPLGSVTSVGMTITAATALSVAGSPITTSGTFAVTWTGSNTQYVAGDGSLITFPTLTSGTVTAVNSGAGMDFTNFTTSGTIILGTPSTITLASVNGASGTTHSHEFDLGGLSTEYLAGDNTLQAFPTIPTVTPSALTKTDDTNILLNLTGTPSTSLLQAVDIEVAWSGLLSYTRGGTGLGSLGTANQLLRVNAGATALEYFTPTWTSNTGTVTNFSANDLTTGYPLPFFTVNVTNPTTTPDLTFSFPSLPQKYVFAAPYGVTGTPLWRQLYPGDIAQDLATVGQVITWNGTQWTPQTPTGGGVTSVSAGNGMNFTTITTTGAVTMGTPSSITLASTNSASGTTHSHALALGGTSAQYLRGDNTLATFPTIVGNYVANADANGGYSANVGTNPNTLTKNQFTYITGHANMFLGVAGHLITIGAASSYGAQIGIEATGTEIGWRSNVASVWNSWKTLADKAWVTTNFFQYWTHTVGTTSIHPYSGFSGYGVSTYAASGNGYAKLTPGGGSQSGYLEIYSPAHVRQGYIGYFTGELAYSANVGNHHFYGGAITVDNIPTGSTSVNLLTSSGLGSGTIQSRTIASLTGLTTDVFKIQGGTTNASAITDDIYHNGKLKLGTSTSSAYQLSVSGTGYFTSTVDFNNNVGIQGFTTGAVIKNLIKMNSSNIVEIGVSGNDITLPSYLNSRNDSSVTPANYLFTSSAGLLLSRPGSEVINNFASLGYNSTGQTITANSTYTNITTATYNGGSSFSPYTYSSNNLVLTAGGHQLQAIIEYVMDAGGTGTPEVFAQFTVNGGAVSNSEGKMQFLGTCWRLPILIHSTASAGHILRVQIKVTTGTGNIKVTRCNIFANPTA